MMFGSLLNLLWRWKPTFSWCSCKEEQRSNLNICFLKENPDRYLNFSSHHHPRILASVVACLRLWAANVCDSTNESLKVAHLNIVFRANGCTPPCIEPILHKKHECHQSTVREGEQKPPEEENKSLFVICLSERIDRVCKSIDSVKIKTAFKPIKTLRQVLTRVKNKIPQENS